MKKDKEPPYKQIPQILIDNMENEIRSIRKLILHYLDKLNRNGNLELLSKLVAHEQELLEIYMRDYKEMREYYADKKLINIS